MTSVYSIYDVKTKKYSTALMLQENDDVAMRTLQASIQPNSLLFMFPQDYELWYIGEFSDTEGLFYNAGELELPRPHRICTCSDFQKVGENIDEVQK